MRSGGWTLVRGVSSTPGLLGRVDLRAPGAGEAEEGVSNECWRFSCEDG